MMNYHTHNFRSALRSDDLILIQDVHENFFANEGPFHSNGFIFIKLCPRNVFVLKCHHFTCHLLTVIALFYSQFFLRHTPK